MVVCMSMVSLYILCLVVRLMLQFLLSMAAHNSVLRLLSYNCHGYNASKRSYMEPTLLSKCDFLFCQLHWLSGGQLDRLDTHSNRLCALYVIGEKVNLLLICVYMPCESPEIAFDEFCTALTQIADIVDSCEAANTIIRGDFNVDFSRNT